MLRTFLSLLLTLALLCSAGMAATIFETMPPESPENTVTAQPESTPAPDSQTSSGTEESSSGIGHLGGHTSQIASQPTPMPVELTPPESIPVAPKKAWTVMVYLCGSNLESGNAGASRDLVEMAGAGFNEDEINVVALTGGSSAWGIPYIQPRALNLLEVHSETLYRAGMFELADMGLPETLSGFLNVVHDHYPADHYALVLWNHGGGPNQGVCIDELFQNDRILTEELLAALKDSPFASTRLDWIGFDACLMGSVEIADALAPYADYLIASEETEPGMGWNYAMLRGMEKDSSPEDTGRRIVDTYFEGLAPYQEHLEGLQTLAVIDLKRIDPLVDAIGDLFEDLGGILSEDTYSAIASVREHAVPFGHVDDPTKYVDYDLLDLMSFLDRLNLGSEDARNAVRKALEDAVVYFRANTEGLGGLSMYYPYYSGAYYRYFEEAYAKMAPSESYTKFIGQFLDYLNGPPQANYSEITTSLKTSKDIRTLFAVLLTPEQRAHLAEIFLRIYEQDPETGNYALVAAVPEVDMDEEGNVSADYPHRALFVVDASGNPLSPALPYTLLSDGNYAVEAVLIRETDSGTLRHPARLIYAREDKEGTLRLITVEGQDAFTGAYTGRNSLDPATYSSIELTRQTRKPVYASEGVLGGYETWEAAESTSYSYPLDGSFNLMMLHQALNEDHLFAAFAIRDLQNGLYSSSLVPVTNTPPPPNTLSVTYDDEDIYTLESMTLTRRENKSLLLAFRVTNTAGAEFYMRLVNLRVNGTAVDAGCEIFGNGPHDGLVIGEEQPAMLTVPASIASAFETIESLEFELEIVNAETGEIIATAPVHAQIGH